MYDIITFGSATRDIFVRSKKFKVLASGDFPTKQGLCVSFDSKLYIEDIIFATGGGGTNTAAAFALQGLKTAYVGKIGKDPGGKAIREELEGLGIKCFLTETDERKTAYSIILSAQKGRSILVYKGACHLLKEKDIPWKNLESKWFYLAPLSGRCVDLFKPLLDFVQEKKIKLAANLGESQIKLGPKILKPFLKEVNILILNQEEASLLTEISFDKEKAIFKKLDELVKEIVVMTKGPKGVMVSDGKSIYEAGIPKSKLIERTGAGDAFGAGFVSGFIKKNDISYAIQLGTANATSVVEEVGAKNGLLKKGKWGKWEKVEVRRSKL